MMIFEREYIRYSLGAAMTPAVILDAPHGVGPSPLPHDVRTCELVEAVADRIGSPWIQSRVNRTFVDLNRWVDPVSWDCVCAHVEYRQAFRHILQHHDLLDETGRIGKPVLLLPIHGMRDLGDDEGIPIDIELGTRGGVLASLELGIWTRNWWAANSPWNPVLDNRFSGHASLSVHIHGGDRAFPGYLGYGEGLSIIQVEFSNTLRTNNFLQTVDLLSRFVENYIKIRWDLPLTKRRPRLMLPPWAIS